MVIGSPMVPSQDQLADYRKDPAKKKLPLQEVVEDLIFRAEVYKWQANRGNHFVHEHLVKSIAWGWASMEEVLVLADVRTVVCEISA